MLQSLRDSLQGWIAWVIIGAIALTFVALGAGDLLGFTNSDPIAAKVNSQKITQRELDIAYDKILQQPGNDALRSLDQKAIKKDILNTLIEQALITQQADRIGMRVSPKAVTSMISSIPFLQKEGQFSPALYQRFLASYNYSDKEFRTILKEDILRNQLLQGINQSAFATRSDIDEAISLMKQKRRFRVARYLQKNYESGLSFSQDDLEDYYKAHLASFKTDEKVKLNYIILSLSDFSDKVEPEPKALADYYQSHIKEFTEPEKIKVSHILVNLQPEANEEKMTAAKDKIAEVTKQLQSGQPFESVAKTYSEDLSTAETGGELSWFSKGEMLPEIESAIDTLKPGEITSVIETRYGYHVFKLIDRQPKKVAAFEAVQDDIKKQLQAQVAEEKFLQAVDDLATQAFDSPDSLEVVAEKLELPLKSSTLFSMKEGPKASELQNPQVLAAAFSPSVLVDKMNSDLIKLDDQNYMVLRAVEYVPSLQKPLSDVRNELQAKLIQDKSSELAKQAALTAQSTLLQTKLTLLPEVMQQYPWETYDNVTRFDNDVDSDILNAAFSLIDHVTENDRVMKVAEYGNGNYALIWLLDVKDGDPEAISKEDRESYAKSLSHQYGELDIALYIKGLMGLAKVRNEVDVENNG